MKVNGNKIVNGFLVFAWLFIALGVILSLVFFNNENTIIAGIAKVSGFLFCLSAFVLLLFTIGTKILTKDDGKEPNVEQVPMTRVDAPPYFFGEQHETRSGPINPRKK